MPVLTKTGGTRMRFEIAPKETESQANWDDARLYCFALNIDGKTGWRLPTIYELIRIYNSKNDFEKLLHSDFNSRYWSSSERGGSHAWYQDFYNGSLYSFDKNHAGVYVRAIRDL